MNRVESYYHYTSLTNSKSIAKDGLIRAGRLSGKVYLTTVLYATAREAEAQLSILGKKVECAVELRGGLGDRVLVPSQVKPLVDLLSGLVIREGNGIEVSHNGDLVLSERLIQY